MLLIRPLIVVLLLVLLIVLAATATTSSAPTGLQQREGEASSSSSSSSSSNSTKSQDQRSQNQSHHQSHQSRRPNIVLLFADDLGYGDVGYNGHPTTRTPNLDSLAHQGKILSSWYSGCNVCTGSRASIMTGRQFLRTGLPGVLGPTSSHGLPLSEITIAQQLKQHHGGSEQYITGAVGKWHLGQRSMYLPANRGFDYYLGIPYSDDMGKGQQSSCGPNPNPNPSATAATAAAAAVEGNERSASASGWSRDSYEKLGLLLAEEGRGGGGSSRTASSNPDDDDEDEYDPAKEYLPLVYQERNLISTDNNGVTTTTRVLEQPVDFTTLAIKYNNYITNFIQRHGGNGNGNRGDEDKTNEKQKQPFFLYVPFSHVHTTRNTPEKQYAGCQFQNSTKRGTFGDALAEMDWMVGNMVQQIREQGIENNTLILFASDNGPWLETGLSGGSVGLLTGRYSGYWDTGKGSTWEGGIRMPAFAYWPSRIEPGSRTSEIVSSLDIFPTLSSLANKPLPSNVTIDGKDMSDILLGSNIAKSKHEFLFFYGTCDWEAFKKRPNGRWGVAAVRHGPYKAHWCTGPGLSGKGKWRKYRKIPLMFNIEHDPSESIPINADVNGTTFMPDDDAQAAAAMDRIIKAHAFEVATFTYGTNIPEPDGPNEGPGRYGVCCDRSRKCNCNSDGTDGDARGGGGFGLFNIGTKLHHDTYHDVLGEEEPYPPRTRAQILLQQQQQQNAK